jgi:hypothetical protein
MIPGIGNGLKNLDFLFGYQGTVQPADEFFRFPGKHAAANYFDPAGAAMGFFST